MGKLQQRIGQSELVEDLQYPRMDGITAEFAIEIFMGFEERNRDSLAGEKKR